MVYLWEIVSAGIRLTTILSRAGVLLGSGGLRPKEIVQPVLISFLCPCFEISDNLNPGVAFLIYLKSSIPGSTRIQLASKTRKRFV